VGSAHAIAAATPKLAVVRMLSRPSADGVALAAKRVRRRSAKAMPSSSEVAGRIARNSSPP